jgi:predicted MFS family arabinose efflux permease
MRGTYQQAFAWLAIPAVCALVTLLLARRQYPDPTALEIKTQLRHVENPRRAFWLYTTAGALIALGFADYPLIAFHLAHVGSLSPVTIPIVYAIAMLMDAASALTFGRLFDRAGPKVIALGILVGAVFAPLVFWGTGAVAIAGILAWGAGLGVQESVLRAGLTSVVSSDKRASAYGLFDTVFGMAWFAGSATIGFLYDHSLTAVVIFATVVQLAAIPFALMATLTHQ